MMLYAWKFLIPHGRPVVVPQPPERKCDGELLYDGCVAVAVSETVEGAKEALRKYARENGRDLSWIEVCDNGPERGKCMKIEIAEGSVLSLSMV